MTKDKTGFKQFRFSKRQYEAYIELTKVTCDTSVIMIVCRVELARTAAITCSALYEARLQVKQTTAMKLQPDETRQNEPPAAAT